MRVRGRAAPRKGAGIDGIAVIGVLAYGQAGRGAKGA